MKKAISILLAFGFVLQLGLFSAFAAPKVAVASVKVTPISIKWAVGNIGTIKASVTPATATNKAVSWKSSNPAVVSIDSTGKVKALALGTATITCTAKDGSGKKSTCAATVTAPKTVKEIVTLYNNTANATKAYKGTIAVSGKQGTTTTIKTITGGSLVKGLAQDMVPNDFGPIKTKTFKNGKEVGGTGTLKKTLPCDDKATASTLDPAGVKSATCIKSGAVWKVSITLKSETCNNLNDVPKYHGACMDTLNLTADDLKPFTLVSAKVIYTDKTTIKADVNAKGLLNSVSIYEPDDLSGTLKYSLITVNTTITGIWEQYLTFKY